MTKSFLQPLNTILLCFVLTVIPLVLGNLFPIVFNDAKATSITLTVSGIIICLFYLEIRRKRVKELKAENNELLKKIAKLSAENESLKSKKIDLDKH